MNCPHCQAPLDAPVPVCPACGKAIAAAPGPLEEAFVEFMAQSGQYLASYRFPQAVEKAQAARALIPPGRADLEERVQQQMVYIVEAQHDWVIQRARVMMLQQQFVEAERILKEALAVSPDVEIEAMLARAQKRLSPNAPPPPRAMEGQPVAAQPAPAQPAAPAGSFSLDGPATPVAPAPVNAAALSVATARLTLQFPLPGAKQIRVHLLSGSSIVFGRDAGCDVVLRLFPRTPANDKLGKQIADRHFSVSVAEIRAMGPALALDGTPLAESIALVPGTVPVLDVAGALSLQVSVLTGDGRASSLPAAYAARVNDEPISVAARAAGVRALVLRRGDSVGSEEIYAIVHHNVTIGPVGSGADIELPQDVGPREPKGIFRVGQRFWAEGAYVGKLTSDPGLALAAQREFTFGTSPIRCVEFAQFGL